MEFEIRQATTADFKYAQAIVDEVADSAKKRGTGIARRTPEYIQKKMADGEAIIAFAEEERWAGFCYIESWTNKDFVANSGLIVDPGFRGHGLARKIKEFAFDLSRKEYPKAKIFGLTTGKAVMNINSDLGYRPVTYTDLTGDDKFWAGCKSCVNYPILQSKGRKNCLCTAMLYDPEREKKKKERQKQKEKRNE